mmetsp:Transcript_6862/g.17962  ORF Transcript_6862/g.17962 Transcript_6862/m.17962 type:complete len:245 (+) Transcript_6862:245-979(+)
MRAGSKEAYNVAATLEEFARPGGSQADLTLDLAKGFATLEGTGRDEAASELRSLSVSSGLARVVNARVEERHREGSTVVTQPGASLGGQLTDLAIIGHRRITSGAGGLHVFSRATLTWTDTEGECNSVVLYLGHGVWVQGYNSEWQLVSVMWVEMDGRVDSNDAVQYEVSLKCMTINVLERVMTATYVVKKPTAVRSVGASAIVGIATLAPGTLDEESQAVQNNKETKAVWPKVIDVAEPHVSV